MNNNDSIILLRSQLNSHRQRWDACFDQVRSDLHSLPSGWKQKLSVIFYILYDALETSMGRERTRNTLLVDNVATVSQLLTSSFLTSITPPPPNWIALYNPEEHGRRFNYILTNVQREISSWPVYWKQMAQTMMTLTLERLSLMSCVNAETRQSLFGTGYRTLVALRTITLPQPRQKIDEGIDTVE